MLYRAQPYDKLYRARQRGEGNIYTNINPTTCYIEPDKEGNIYTNTNPTTSYIEPNPTTCYIEPDKEGNIYTNTNPTTSYIEPNPMTCYNRARQRGKPLHKHQTYDMLSLELGREGKYTNPATCYP
jgi:hypothetical protein